MTFLVCCAVIDFQRRSHIVKIYDSTFDQIPHFKAFKESAGDDEAISVPIRISLPSETSVCRPAFTSL
jgi:hypothetical protein